MKKIYYKDINIDNKDILLDLWIQYLEDIRVCKNNNFPLNSLEEDMLYIIDEYSHHFEDKIEEIKKLEESEFYL